MKRSFLRPALAHKPTLFAPALLTMLFAAPSAFAEVTVSLDEVHQRIDGFGASAVFFSADISEEDADFLFDPRDGIGLSLVRVRAHSNHPVSGEIKTAQKAYAYGARIWSAAWTPPIEMKTNGALWARDYDDPAASEATDGHLKPESYADYATYLADFADWMEEQGVPLTAMTPQNEPDYPAGWDGCIYTPQEMATFIADHLGPTLAARGHGDILLIAPDTAMLGNLDEYTTEFEKHPELMALLDGVSTHPYSVAGLPDPYTWPKDHNLFLWQTEVSWEQKPADSPDPTMKTAIWMTSMMHDHLTRLEMNAWNYWNLTAKDSDYDNADGATRANPALIQNGEKYKRAYAMGNFSKFIRPGFSRVGTSASTETGVLVSAYKGEDKLVIVAVNPGDAPSMQTFKVTGAGADQLGQAVPWITSPAAEHNLAEQPPLPLTCNTNGFQATLLPQSVTTFVLGADGLVGVGDVLPMGGAPGLGGAGNVPLPLPERGTTCAEFVPDPAPATGGSAGTGGAGTGGAAAGGGGTDVKSESNCSCRTAGGPGGGTTAAALAGLAGLGLLLARRRSRVH